MARRRSRAKRGGGVLVWGGWCVAGLVVVVVVGYFALTAWLRSYLHSDRFREMMGAKVSAFLKAEGEFGAFHWEGVTAMVDGYEAVGYEDAAFSALRLCRSGMKYQ